MRMRTGSWMAWVAAATLAVATAACGDDSGGTGGEGGADTSEGGTDTGEGGTDTGEGGTDTGEGGTDTGEGGTDTGEGGTDTGEGGTDTGEGGTDTGEGGTDTGEGGEDTGEGGEDTGEGGEPCDKEEGICNVTYPEVYGPSMRVNSIQIGAGGQPGEALDIDDLGDADCAPAANCSAGIDNSLTVIASLANSALQESVDDGSVNIIAEISGDPSAGPFTLNMYVGDLHADNAECDPTTTSCNYEVSDSSWGCDCELLVQFEATADGGALMAGGDDAVFAFSLPLGDVNLDIAAYRARLVGDIAFGEGGAPTLTNGVLGGAVRKADIIAAIEALPDDALPLPKAAIIPIVQGLAADIDTDGDGTDEALSIGLKVSGSPANIVGVQD